jgi:hypothetical protein
LIEMKPVWFFGSLVFFSSRLSVSLVFHSWSKSSRAWFGD